MSPIARVLLAEVDTPTRMGVRLALARSGFEVAAEERDAGRAVDAALRERPDLALISADLPGDGIDAARSIAAALPDAKIVVLTPHESGEELVAAVLAGASGYLAKDVSPSRLPLALGAVLCNEAAIPRRYTEDVLAALRGRDARRARVQGRARRFVTNRQWEILDLLGEGHSTAEIARRLGISEVTARRHISSLLPKLGLTDRDSAIELMRERSPR